MRETSLNLGDENQTVNGLLSALSFAVAPSMKLAMTT
jgi:hypothetical protein